MDEKQLYPLWQKFCQKKEWTLDRGLQGIVAGDLNIFEGPDFQGAEFSFDNRIYRGDVEIHHCSKDWYRHGHHLDRRYDQVVLHLSWEDPVNQKIKNSKDQLVINYPMQKIVCETINKHQVQVCRLRKSVSAAQIHKKIQKLALQRLNLKILHIKNELSAETYDQVLFRLLLMALGSPNNQNNFMVLADLISWDWLINIRHRYHFSAENWFFLFLIQSGLINRYPQYLPQRGSFTHIQNILRKTPMAGHLWQLSGQRPGNHPLRHLKSLAAWCSRYSGQSIYQSLRQIVFARSAFNILLDDLFNFFSSTYHQARTGKGPAMTAKEIPEWGRSKKIELIGNVVIPFFLWQAKNQSSIGFLRYLEEFYYFLPFPARYKRIDTLMRKLGLTLAKDLSFHTNQALLYLLDYYCLKEDCDSCPFICSGLDIDKSR